MTLRSMGISDSNPQPTPEGYISPSSLGSVKGRAMSLLPCILPLLSAWVSAGGVEGAGDTHFLLPPTDIDGWSDYCKCYGVV